MQNPAPRSCLSCRCVQGCPAWVGALHVYGQTSVSPLHSHAQMQPLVLNGSRPTIDQVLSGGLWRVDRSFQSSIQIL